MDEKRRRTVSDVARWNGISASVQAVPINEIACISCYRLYSFVFDY